MKYELIPKDILDKALESITMCIQSDSLNECRGIRLVLSRVYNAIQNNRKSCNVQPEGETNMENKEIRYIQIESCTNCEHVGHTGKPNGVTFVCGNPLHQKLPIPRELIGEIGYPIIISKQNNYRYCPIPSWCKLPSDVQVKQYNPDEE